MNAHIIVLQVQVIAVMYNYNRVTFKTYSFKTLITLDSVLFLKLAKNK